MFFYKVLTKFTGKKDPLENLYYSFHWDIFNPIRFMQSLFDMHQQYADMEFAKNPNEKRTLDKAREFYKENLKKLSSDELKKLYEYLCTPEIQKLRQTFNDLIGNDKVANEKMNFVFATQKILEATIEGVEKALPNSNVVKRKYENDIKIEPKIEKINANAILIIADKIEKKELKLFTPVGQNTISRIPTLKAWVEMSYRRLQRRPAEIKLIDQELQKYWAIYDVYKRHFTGIDGRDELNKLFLKLKGNTLLENISTIKLDDASMQTIKDSLSESIGFLKRKQDNISKITLDINLQDNVKNMLKLVIAQLEKGKNMLDEGSGHSLTIINEFNTMLKQIEVNLFQGNLTKLNQNITDWLVKNPNNNRNSAVEDLKRVVGNEIQQITEKAQDNKQIYQAPRVQAQ